MRVPRVSFSDHFDPPARDAPELTKANTPRLGSLAHDCWNIVNPLRDHFPMRNRSPASRICRRSSRFGLSGGLLLIVAFGTCGPVARAQPQSGERRAEQESQDDAVLNFPANTSLALLVDYVSDRLNLNVVYDSQLARSQVTLRTPKPVPVQALRPLLNSLLAANGFALVGDGEEGVLRVVPQQQMASAAKLGAGREGDRMPGATVVIEVFDLAHADPVQAEAALRPFLSGQGAVLSSDSQRRQLVVTDVASRIEDLAELVARLDQPTPAAAVRYHNVQHSGADVLRDQLSTLLSATEAGGSVTGTSRGGGAPPVQLIADSRTNRLAIVGPESLVARAIELAEELDSDLGLVPRIYPLQNVTPERVDRLVRSVLSPRIVEQQYRATLDDPGGLYVVTATEGVHAAVESLVQQLDVAPDAESNPIRFYRIQNVDADDVLRTIRSIAGEGLPNSGAFGREPGASQGGASRSAEDQLAQDGFRGDSTDAAGPGGRRGFLGADEARPLDFDALIGNQRPFEVDDRSQGVRRGRPGLGGNASREIASVRTEGLTVTADPNTNTIIVIADPPLQRFYEELIQRLDVRRPQVLIEATIVTIDTSDAFTLGVEVSTGDFAGETQRFGFSRFGLSEIDDAGRLDLIPGLGFNGAVLQADVADVIVRALKTDARARVVASPRILVNDNATGTIASLAEQPVTSINQGLNSDVVTFSQFVSAGTEIVVSPQIAEADFVRLAFSVSLDSFTGDGGAGVPPPRQSNVVESEVTVPDGSTIVVGGINRQDSAETVSRIPILGQIPILEHLFSSRTKTDSTATLFVFLKPVVLRDDRFEDLKYISAADLKTAGLDSDPDGLPKSEPLIME